MANLLPYQLDLLKLKPLVLALLVLMELTISMSSTSTEQSTVTSRASLMTTVLRDLLLVEMDVLLEQTELFSMEPYPLLYYQDLELLLLMLTVSPQLMMMDLHLLLVSEVSKPADLQEEDQEDLHSAALDQVALVLELYSHPILSLLQMELLPLLMEVLSMFSFQEVLLLLRELQLLEPDLVELPSHPLLVDGADTTPQKEQLPTAHQDFPASTLSALISLLSRLVTPSQKQVETDSLSVQTHS
jgi:hypothetical protein